MLSENTVTRLLLLLACVCALLLAACAQEPVEDPQATPTGDAILPGDPILAIAHGSILGASGEELKASPEFIYETQQYYIEELKEQASSSDDALAEEEVSEIEELIYRLVEDEILANAILIDWLLEQAPLEYAHVAASNNGLRWIYFLDILGQQWPEGLTEWNKGVEDDVAEELEENGVSSSVQLLTEAGGRAYRDECSEAGVPVPDAMFSSEWVSQGVFDREFISTDLQAELWLHESESPPGLCLALPRYGALGGGGFSDQAELLGIICLGTQSNKSCFFDNPRGTKFTRGVEVGLEQFVGGVDLVANGQGVCSDCHSGENPYVVHPEKAPFASLPSLQPSGWPDPLVDASWPQNPGPTNLLDAITSTERCDSCHRSGIAGRFPDISTGLPGYCGIVLENAMNEDILSIPSPPVPDKRTMPPFGNAKTGFVDHIDAIRQSCGLPPSGGGVVVEVDDLPDDEGYISPPIIIEPLYQCASKVAVRSMKLDAEVTLFVNGTAIDTLTARNPDFLEFDVPSLVATDMVSATQKSDGAIAQSETAVVRDHTEDYPDGLPEPAIDPTLIYECASVISVRHVPGATITVHSGGPDVTFGTSTDWTLVSPGKRPFEIGDSFAATVQLCSDVAGPSETANAVAAPSPITEPVLVPAETFGGQELVSLEELTNGALQTIEEAAFGPVAEVTTSVPWYGNLDIVPGLGRPLNDGEQLIGHQMLCDMQTTAEWPPALSCEELPAPRIEHPLVGRDFVIVSQAVPGATVRVYDDTGDELGDGSGIVIKLKRVLTGTDILTVVQQVGECTSSTGYRVSVRNVNPDNS